MPIHLHKQATTTPKVRAAIQASTESASALAERFGTTEQTVYKWRHRSTVHDLSHTPHRLQIETEQETIQWIVSPSRADPGAGGGGGGAAQDAAGVARRPAGARHWARTNGAFNGSLREFLNPEVSRSGLDRCLRRHGVGNLRDLQAGSPRPAHKAFKAYAPGYLHVDVKYLPQMADETSRRYLFVAIDRATRWVFIRIYPAKTAANARRFLRDLERACPLRIRTILTENGKEFTDRLFGLRKRSPTGKHEFDLPCAELGIELRLAPPQHPQTEADQETVRGTVSPTNGIPLGDCLQSPAGQRVERFNGRIEEVLQSHQFHFCEDLETTLHRLCCSTISSCRSQPLAARHPCRR